jgi:hypothetical protein
MKMVKSLLLGKPIKGISREGWNIDEGNGGISPGPGTGGERIKVFNIEGAGFG